MNNILSKNDLLFEVMKEKDLTIDEKQFLIFASRGDTVSLKK